MTRSVLQGRPGSSGIGVGRILRVPDADTGAPTGSASAAATPVTTGATVTARPTTTAGSTAAERERLEAALEAAAADLASLAEQTASRAGEEVGAIFEAQALFARDPGVVGPALAMIETGIAADVAILRATDEQAAVLASVDDPYFRERAADVRDVGRRVAASLRGDRRPDLWHADGVAAVIVATDLDPSAVATLRPELVAGIALAGGAPTGHAAIVARALGIPLVLGLGPAADELAMAVTALVDGGTGDVVIDPDEDEIARRTAAVVTTPDVVAAPGIDGGERPAGRAEGDGWAGGAAHVAVAANVASALEAEAAKRAGADGIGLLRTELLFLGRTAPPSVGEQRATYAAIRTAIDGRPVVFRTLDIGGDKPASWGDGTAEANPALGVRGLRLGLIKPDLLEDQLAALLQAAAGGELRVMLPMVSTREELDAARAHLEAARARIVAEGGTGPTDVRLGVMIEVPSAALMADSLAEAADFFSIGTNDLVQYTLAADRTNPNLADLATALQPAVLRLIDWVVRAAARHGRHVAVCGESAADPRMIPLLVGLGVDELSVTPGSIAAVRAVLATLDVEACRGLAGRALVAPTLADVVALTAS